MEVLKSDLFEKYRITKLLGSHRKKNWSLRAIFLKWSWRQVQFRFNFERSHEERFFVAIQSLQVQKSKWLFWRAGFFQPIRAFWKRLIGWIKVNHPKGHIFYGHVNGLCINCCLYSSHSVNRNGNSLD